MPQSYDFHLPAYCLGLRHGRVMPLTGRMDSLSSRIPSPLNVFCATRHQALRHPWVLDGRLYPGSGGSSSDSSDFGCGGGGAEDDQRAPNPHDIPSELLGADSDTEEDEPAKREDLQQRKEGREQGGRRRRGYRPTAPPAPPPPQVVVPPAAVTATGRRDDGNNGGGTGNPGVTAVAEAVILAQATQVTTAPAVLGGIREEDATEEAEVDAAVSALRPDQGVSAVGGAGERQALPPRPAPPPPPPPPPAVAATVSASTPASLSASTVKAKKATDRRGVGSPGSGGVHSSGENVDGVSLVGGVGVGEAEARAAGEEATATAAVAAEAAAEEAAAAKQAAAAMAATVVAASVATSTETSRSQPPLQPSSPLARIDTRQPFVTPRKARSPRPLDVFSSPPLAPQGSGRAVAEEESEFLLDAAPPLPPEKGRTRSRDGLPPSGSGHPRLVGAAALRPLGGVDRPLSMGVAGMAIVEAEAGRREGVVAVAPPAFHDLVKRSTRFMTSGENVN